MTRREEPQPWQKIAADTARKVAPWPSPERAEPGAAVREALAGTARPVRRPRQ